MTDTQKYLRTLAEEVVSDISTLGPFQCKELLGSFVAELFAVVAEEELREQRRQRQAEGIAVAKSKGVHFGCRRLELPDGLEEYCKMWEDGKISLRKAAEALQISHATFYRRCREYREKKMENCSKL